MNDLSFKEAMDYLKSLKIVDSQKALAKKIKRPESLISKEAKKWRFPRIWVDDLLKQHPELKEGLGGIKSYDPQKTPYKPPYIAKNYLFFDRKDASHELIAGYEASRERLVDTFAVKIEHAKVRAPKFDLEKGVFFFEDRYGGLSPIVDAGDTMACLRCDEFRMEGVYIVKDHIEFKPKYIQELDDNELLVQDLNGSKRTSLEDFKKIVVGYAFNCIKNLEIDQMSAKLPFKHP